MTTPGAFIVLDGNEGSGKSTQLALLRDHLVRRGRDVLLVRDPGATAIGEKIRAILLDPANTELAMRSEMLLYMAARAQMMSQVIVPALERGTVVLSDRFVSSTLAYQLGGEGLTADEIRSVAEVAIRGRWPDLTVLLDMPADQSMQRVQRPRDRIEQRSAEYHAMVRRNFLDQAKADPDRYRVVAADRDVQSVQEDVVRAVESGREW